MRSFSMPFISPFLSPFLPYNRAYAYRGLTASLRFPWWSASEDVSNARSSSSSST
ncbi:MAG: hypothetical protein KZQ60_06455 [Candidatus Thiodiazotropha sp. (ex Lucinoma aequizonata)]|nr:hypothetical protein [Candidatus Thiodiazotropha sp. (ex Lucinoma aequizonata)]MCU7888396.1 hypothetical protein [Candidatus Thiodiazotropha sp. (ex Lucinoma aequizonata)]MCU7900490.1 hypothetical protein [Candidatus Thiodiazotropha sp. (ex Lucinoma aequizonata)]MCU7907561.1 hypothetical protein [Candidatus Thiodiazotropha sp. (ex Lucinoma aequizonata)]MCU7911607.1 hypothetical protein [Candidatus Thiodiazotropha sp. (ex Lucinoma aequizonata)]